METWVVVDDSDRAINYTGSWAWTSTAIDSVGSAIAFDNTAHAVLSPDVANATDSPASFFYSFKGSKLAVYGIAATFNRSLQVPGPSLPQWQCIVDNSIVIPNNNPYGFYPWESYCESDDLQDGQHTLEFRVTQSGIGLWFDSLRFLPSPKDTSQTNVTVWIDSTDTRLEYGPGWKAIGTGYMSTKESSPAPLKTPAFFMNYNGSSLSWYAFSKAAMEKAQPDLPALTYVDSTTTSGFYRIDSGPLVPFPVDLSAQPVTTELNPYSTILFRTAATVPGPHNLTVFYDGNSTVWPLTLDYITVENSLISGTPSPIIASFSADNKTSVIAGAVGGVLGGLFILFLGLFALRRWRVQKQQQYRKSRALYLTKADIKLRPFSRMGDPEEEKGKGGQQYPFSSNPTEDEPK